MTELPANDYISQINKNGSGLNIPQIVGALVDARIEPLKTPINANKEKVEAAISGLALLKKSSELTATNIAKLKSSGFNTTSSTDITQVVATVATQSLVKPGTSKITKVTQLAQAMSFSIPAPGSNTAFYTAPNSAIGNNYSLTIKVGGTYTNNSAGTADVFTTASGFKTTGVSLGSGEGIIGVAKKLDDIDGLNAKVIKVGNSQYKIMVTSETGEDNAFEIASGVDTGNGANRAFDVWDNSPIGGGTATAMRTFHQDAKDLKFKLDGLDVARASNTVTDVISGVSFEVKVAGGAGVEIKTERSKTSVQEAVQSFIAEINAYKADLAALSKFDRTGAGENGDLYGDQYIKSRMTALSDFMRQPIRGYSRLDTSPNQTGVDGLERHVEDEQYMVHLSNLGFKTQKDGTIGFDQTMFDSTFKNEPTRFDALTTDRAFTDNPDFTLSWDGGVTQSDGKKGIQPGVYLYNLEYHSSSNNTQAIYRGKNRTNHTQHITPDNGKTSNGVTTYTYSDNRRYQVGTVNEETSAGLSFLTTNPAAGDSTKWPNGANGNSNHIPITVNLATSFATLFENLHDEVLNNRYEHRRQVANYETKALSLEERLAKIDLRSNSLAQMYNTQFQEMESAVTGFNTTGNYLTSVVDAWNKD